MTTFPLDPARSFPHRTDTVGEGRLQLVDPDEVEIAERGR